MDQNKFIEYFYEFVRDQHRLLEFLIGLGDQDMVVDVSEKLGLRLEVIFFRDETDDFRDENQIALFVEDHRIFQDLE